MKRTAKYFFFNNRDLAERFIELYWGIVSCDFSSTYWSVFYRNYFGEKNVGKMTMVTSRMTTEELNEVCRVLNMKKKRWNGHLCYRFIES